MDVVNVFVVNGVDTFNLLIHFSCTYALLVEMIVNQLKLDMRHLCVKIEYNVDVDISSIRITDNNSLQFYLELKRKDPRITVYVLHISLIDLLQSITVVGTVSYGN